MKSFTVLLGLLGLLPSLAHGSPDMKIESYGDSITAGFLSGESLTTPPPLKIISKIISDLAMFAITDKSQYTSTHHAPLNAWPNQIAEILRKDGSQVTLMNRSVSGSASWDLTGQLVPGVGGDRIAYFFSGNNDICENSEPVASLVQRFEQQFDAALAQWDASHTGSRAYLVPVPRLDRVFSTLRGFVWYKGGQGSYRCEDCWKKFFPYCPSFYRMEKDGKLKDFMEPRVNAMNHALERMADKWNRSSKGNVFVMLPNVHDVAFKPEYFSIDCYHPSAFGQRELGEAIFKASSF